MMLTPIPERRPGVTLVEVLAAIFIMAVGLMALLTLFPLGALSMAQAVKDDRTGTLAKNAHCLAMAGWTAACEEDQRLNNNPPNPGSLTSALLNPTPYSPAPPASFPLPDRTGFAGPSYPVFIDSIAYSQYANLKFSPNNWRDWIGGIDPLVNPGNPPTVKRWPSVPRMPVYIGSTAISGPAAQYFCTDADALTFDPGGTGLAAAPTERQRRYSFAYMVRRPDCRRPYEIDLTVIVFSGRPVEVTPELYGTGEYVYPNTQFFQGATSVTLNWAAGAPAPPIRPGYWIMDGTLHAPGGPHAWFYRVTNVSQTSSTSVDLELQTPIRENSGGAGYAIVLENAVEVFEKGIVAP